MCTNLKFAAIIFTENFHNVLLLKTFLKEWVEYWYSHSLQFSLITWEFH